MPITGDNPISNESDDVLSRSRLAQSIAAEIRAADASQGFVAAILGPWGSGKTSLLNLVRLQLEAEPQIAVLEFNPWMFSGAEQLLESFFGELAAQLRAGPERLRKLADDVEAYSFVLTPLQYVPLIGAWAARLKGASDLLEKLREARRDGLAARRNRLSSKLKELDRPIVVVVDDIDRLRTDEIRDMFKLVRLTANFPNIVYLVAFDRARVESALAEDRLPGREYLEKILQVAYDLPELPDRTRIEVLTRAIAEGLEDLGDHLRFDAAAWPDVLAEVISPLVRNMRDVRRYVAAVHGTLLDLDGQVAMVDVLGLEAIRVFLPDTFAALPRAHAALTTTRSIGYGGRENPADRQAVEHLLATAGPHAEVVRDAVRRLFPAGLRYIENNHYGSDWLKRWLRERRVAHPDVLSLYLERVAGEGLAAFLRAEQAFALLTDQLALDAHLSAIRPEELESTIASLENYEGEFPADAVVPGSTVLLNWLDRLPDRPRGMFDFGQRFVVTRVVLRMLRVIGDPAALGVAADEILSGLNSLSGQLELITLVGHQENAGHRLVSEAKAGELEADWRRRVAEARPEELLLERDLLRLLIFARRSQLRSEQPLVIPRDPSLELALLRSAVNEVRSQSVDSRSLRRTNQLSWDALELILGGTEPLNQMVDRLTRRFRNSSDPAVREALELAARYRSGWRPSDFDDD